MVWERLQTLTHVLARYMYLGTLVAVGCLARTAQSDLVVGMYRTYHDQLLYV